MVVAGRRQHLGTTLMLAVGVLTVACNSTRRGAQHSVASGGSAAGAGLPDEGLAGSDDSNGGTGGSNGGAGAAGAGFAGTGEVAPAARLSMLSFSSGELLPAYDAEVTEYELKLAPLAAATVSLLARSAPAGAELTLNDTRVILDGVSAELTIDATEALTVDVASPGHTSTRYHVQVERDAATAITIEGLSVAASSHAWDGFGTAVATGPGWLALGGPGEDSIDGAAPAQFNVGKVDMLAPNTDGKWLKYQRLKGSSSGKDSAFGASLAAFGDLLLVGAPGEISHPPPDVTHGGAAYLFRRRELESQTSWQEVARFKSPTPLEGAGFGAFVALTGDTLAIGSSNDGEVHLFRDLGDDQWTHERTISNDALTVGIALTAEHLAVAGPDRACAARAVVYEKGTVRAWTRRCTWFEDTFDPAIPEAIALDGETLAVAYPMRVDLYAKAAATWQHKTAITAQQAPFRGALVLDNGRLFVSAPADASPALGVNGDASDQSAGSPIGAVHFFRLAENGQWLEQAYIKPTAAALKQVAGAGFGRSLTFGGGMLVVGAPTYDASVDAPLPGQWVPPTSGDPAGGAFLYR